MSTAIKIAIIGAGSAQFSGGLVRDICVSPGLHGSHVVLMDIDAVRLDMIERMAKRLCTELNVPLSFEKTTDRAAALSGVDFVINTAQVGGHDWTEAQRSMAERHGYYRGARLHDCGQSLFFLEVAQDVERICPGAWLIQSANPVFEGCTLMHRMTGVKVLGLCHGHYGYRDVARVLKLDRERVTARMHGFNHWIWMTDFRYDGKDAYPLIDQWIQNEAEGYWAQWRTDSSFFDMQMSPAAIHQYKLYGLMPIGDTPRFAGWWYSADLATKKRWYNDLGGFDSEIGWRQYLDAMGRAVTKIAAAATDRSRPITDTFQPKQSEEQIVPIIDSIVNDKPRLFQVNIPNKNQIVRGFPEDLVIECEGVVSGAGIRGTGCPDLPAKLTVGAMIPRWQQAELVVEALRTRDRDILLMALLHNQKTRSLEQAEALLAEWLGDPRNESLRRWFAAK